MTKYIFLSSVSTFGLVLSTTLHCKLLHGMIQLISMLGLCFSTIYLASQYAYHTRPNYSNVFLIYGSEQNKVNVS